MGVRRPLSRSRVPPPPEDGALEENALPWRLTPICHCSSITDHPAAPEQAADYSPPPADTAGHARRRANKYNAILFIFTHWGGTSGALRKHSSRLNQIKKTIIYLQFNRKETEQM